jgi:type I restriction enzyme R subunit
MNESTVELATLDWLAALGYSVLHGPEIAPGEAAAERTHYGEVLLAGRLRMALARLNPHILPAALEDVQRRITIPESPSLLLNNRAFHRALVDGLPVEYLAGDGHMVYETARLVDFENPDANDWLAVNQFTIVENKHERRPDVLIFLNGMPVAVIELKNPADENATVWKAYNQIQTYKAQIPSLFVTNEVLVISDGLTARVGSLTGNKEWFLPWRTIEGKDQAAATALEIEVLVKGLFERQRFLTYLRHFIVYEEANGGALTKKLAGYHQFHAVNAAVEQTLRARPLDVARRIGEGPGLYRTQGDDGPHSAGNKRIGVIWHTQGSGKSLTMAFYAGRIVLHPAMENPTLVVLTDRNDLDDQLFGTFARCSELLRQQPRQAKDRAELRELLGAAAGGVVFTTVHKFMPDERGDVHPLLSARRNIVVIADEAHRSQYDFVDGFARHIHDALPNASFIGFTGTPIELTDKNTRAVFGDYISVYDIKQAVYDGATVPIYYEARMAKLDFNQAVMPELDDEFDEITEGEEEEQKEKLKSKWAALEAVVGAQPRVNLIAADLIAHFEHRQEGLQGKAMVVCMSRRICVELYDAITALRPAWHSADDAQGCVKIVMTGSAMDTAAWQPHIRNKAGREALALRFKDPADPLEMVIVRDMWLTGFDVPCLHTMYIDKPMRGHGLMQAIARVNRVFHDKPGGLVVDYLGLTEQLQQAVATYTNSGGQGQATIDQAQAVAAFQMRYEVCCDLFHGFDWSTWQMGGAAQLALLPNAQEHILAQEEGKKRCVNAVRELSQAFALAVPHEDVLAVRDDVGFFQAVRAMLLKTGGNGAQDADEVEHAIQQLVASALTSNEVVDIFAAAGLKKPDISILSNAFLEEVQRLPQKNLAVELLRKLLTNEITARSRTNLVQSRKFSEMLEKALIAYQNRAIEAAQVIEELLVLAEEMRAARERGERLGLSAEEEAFYDALGSNDSAVQVMGDDTLKTIARELVTTVRNNVTIDWTQKETVRAKLRVMVKRILRKYGYPPDKQEQATATVLEQAALLSGEWAGE